MDEIERVLDALIADHERAGELSWDQVHRVTQRRNLDGIQTARVVDELSQLGLLPVVSPSVKRAPRVQAFHSPAERSTDTAKPLVDGLGVFMKRASGVALLRPDEEVALARRMRAAEGVAQGFPSQRTPLEREMLRQAANAKRRFIEANLRLVFAWARRPEFQGQGLDYEDLVQAGSIGLMRAVEKFDPDLGYKFSTYAVWWIRQSITRAIADTGRTIRLPVHVQEQVRKISSTQRRLGGELQRPPTLLELADELDMDPGRVAFFLDISRDPVSLDLELDGPGGAVLGEMIPAPATSVEEQVVEAMLQQYLVVLLASLTEREAGVIRMRFGLNGDDPMTLDAIGQVYGVTRERVRQIEAKTLEKLRGESYGGLLRDYLIDPGRGRSRGNALGRDRIEPQQPDGADGRPSEKEMCSQ